MTELLSYDFMQRALLAAVLVGVSAPAVGVFLVQRQLSLIGDGIGHVALAGVAIGVWAHNRVSETWFFRVTYVLLLATGLKLIWDALT